ncbi:MAG TPA: GNAT family protein [Pyrinomonadaceae bacterium]|jgi:RimJ/RimL family protein N-acetyltransferase
MNFWQNSLVRLRGVEPEDAETFFRWNLDSDMGRGLEFLWPPVSLALVRQQLAAKSLRKLERDEFDWLIEDAAGAPVGAISTHHCAPHTGTFSYGVSVAAEHQRRGYATAAVLLVVRYYFEELRYQKVTVGVLADNAASVALHEKLGFTREGTLRRMGFTRGAFRDLHYYGLTREEWYASPLRP